MGRLRNWVRYAWERLFSPVDTGGLSQEEAERRMVREAQQGGLAGQKAFQGLVEEHQRWLVWFLACLLSNRADAEDVAQDVFVRAYLSIERFRGDSKFRTWLRRIAINQAFNFRRAGKRHSAVNLEQTWDVESHDRHREALAAREALLHCLDALPYVAREILVLYHVEELSVREVARTLDIGQSAAKMRLKRARDEFREVYDEDLGEEAWL